MTNLLRLASGLIIFSFVCCHLINHIFGLISIEVMETARGYLLWVWHTLPGTVVFGGAAIVHISIAVRSIYIRRTLRLPAWEWAQIMLGLAIPPFLFKHVLGTRVLELTYGVKVNYPLVLAFQWVLDPVNAFIQITALILAWTHACIGLHFWLRTKVWYASVQAYLALAAIMIPTLAMAGYISAGNRLLAELEAGTRSIPQILSQAGVTPQTTAELQPILVAGYVVIGFILITPFILREGREAFQKFSSLPILKLSNGREFPIDPGASVLEVLRAHRVPHASVCGGRGRCTTCRVQVVEGLEHLPPPEGVEARALDQIQATKATRLACQIRPVHTISVVPMLPPKITPTEFLRQGGFQGHETIVTCIFVDIRGWTTMSEEKLPYDALFILNQFFSEMNQIITESKGHFSQFTGDGLMALYGLHTINSSEGARQAVQAAGAMLHRIENLNDMMRSVLTHELRIGIGIHTGEAIVGRIGPPGSQIITAIGDTINITARLEGLSKDYGVPLILSKETAEAAGLNVAGTHAEKVVLRGREKPIECYKFESVPKGGSLCRSKI
jgi:adenylate cyclase